MNYVINYCFKGKLPDARSQKIVTGVIAVMIKIKLREKDFTSLCMYGTFSWPNTDQ